MSDPIQVQPPAPQGSHIFSISLRGIIALALIGTFCGLTCRLHTDKLVDAFVIVASSTATFYFGQNTKK